MKNFGFIKVAAAIPEVKVADCRYNAESIFRLLKKAANEEVDIVCFPELCITGYTCGDLFYQDLLIEEAEKAVDWLLDKAVDLPPITYIIGAPVKIGNQLHNAAIVCAGYRIVGIVPKTYLPNYCEFYEKRWFNPSDTVKCKTFNYTGSSDTGEPVGTDLLFKTKDNVTFAVEICEDLWAPVPPSSQHAPAGAQLIFNLSASNELTGKHNYLLSLINQQSARCLAGYIYASAGWGESTTDLVFGGNAIISENGQLLAASERFQMKEQLVISEIDVERLNSDRSKISSFKDYRLKTEYQFLDAYNEDEPEEFDLEDFEFNMKAPENSENVIKLTRKIHPLPFVPDEEKRNESCEEIFSIQIGGLAKRMLHTQSKTAIIGVSGGLDSTLALLVCVKTFDKIGISRDKIIGVTMPGFGTTDRTYNNAIQLMKSLGISIREIDIKAACEQHFKDIRHHPETHDATYENSQARERTQILMDIANQMNGLVIGTGDLSELALGWATYNGDHMSMYSVNSGIPKTLVRHLVDWVADVQVDNDSAKILKDIVCTPVSPELLPAKNGQISQCTEDIVGPYELHDFFLYYTIRFGFSPWKVFYLSKVAFEEKYTQESILQWMEIFYKRFFSQQFKRSCIPDGPKVGSINLSPRGDWRMPSDASSELWLNEIKAIRRTIKK